MITRKYFVRAKISHNDNSRQYSWWSGVLNIKTLFVDADLICNLATQVAYDKISKSVPRKTTLMDVEIESLNKL